MGRITHVHACLCGCETECEAEDLMPGAVFQCPACKQVWARVTPRYGGRAWIKVADSDVKFHRLLDEPAADDE